MENTQATPGGDMFITLLGKEIRHAMLSFRFATAFLTMFILILASFWTQADSYFINRDNYNIEQEKSTGRDTSVTTPSRAHPAVHKKPSPLSIFAVGESPRYGNSVTLWRWQVPREASGSFSNNDYLASLPPFDFLTIVSLVISLFAIMLSYDAISGEREQGTLRQQGTCPVSRLTIIGAKFAGNTLVLAIPLVLSVLAGLILLIFSKNAAFTGQQWLCIAIMVLSAICYTAIFTAAGLLCSAVVRHSSISLLLGLLIWLITSMVLPVFAKASAETVLPVASIADFNNAEQASLAEANNAYQEFSEEHPNHPWGYYTGGYGPGTGLGQGTIKVDGNESQFRDAIAYIRFIEPYMLKRARQLWDAYLEINKTSERQAQFAGLWMVLSPANQLKKIYTSLAGTDYAAYQHLMETARTYRRMMLSQFEANGYFSHNALAFFSRLTPEEITEEGFRQRLEGRRSGSLNLLDAYEPLEGSDLPLFRYQSPEPSLDSAALGVAVQLVTALIIFIASYWFFARYDFR